MRNTVLKIRLKQYYNILLQNRDHSKQCMKRKCKKQSQLDNEGRPNQSQLLEKQ